ncbi:hypothetical protein DIJ64_02410 [Mycobacterium leprae]|uniref:Uncharacterized protein n=1 Tax=Mycobacterium leprae TaxID=1769 RepID=A0AAD0KR63_MYCLR|nr:hypothetical protein DIJ64_02410 [Mycobacterium leprae]
MRSPIGWPSGAGKNGDERLSEKQTTDSVAIKEIFDLEQLEVNIFHASLASLTSENRNHAFSGQVSGAIARVGGAYGRRCGYQYALAARPFSVAGRSYACPPSFWSSMSRDGGSFCTRYVSAVQPDYLACHMSTSLQKAKRASSTRTRYLRQPDSKENPEASSMKASDDEIIKQFQE